jgi:GNAT superfamily N-acetyltransferase
VEQDAAAPLELIALPDGSLIRLRPVHPGDEQHLQDLVAHMTPEDVRRRFFAPIRELGPALAHRLANPDPAHDVAFAALPADGDGFLAVGRLSGGGTVAEFALAVRSDAQRRGIGFLLLNRLIERARPLGFALIQGDVLRDNERMLQMCRELGFTADSHPTESSVLRLTKHLSAVPP